MLTFGQVKSSRVQRVAGVCADSDEFRDLVNESDEMLMDRGNFFGTVKRVNFCSYNNCIVFPRRVGTLLALDQCGRSIPPKNFWFNFNDLLPEDVHRLNRFGLGSGSFGGFGAGDGSRFGNQFSVDNGTTSVFNQIPCLNDRYVQFYPVLTDDVGKTITLFGIDGNGLVIRSLRSDGTFQDGIVLTLALPFVQTPFLIRRVDRIIKDPTDGPIYGYQFDGATRYELAVYEPSETVPEYRTANIQGGCGHSNRNCGCPARQFSALVKLQFVPVEHDSDVLGCDDIHAVALMVQAIKQSDSYDHAGAESAISRAVHEANMRLRDKLPIDSIPVRVAYQGTADLRRQKIGYII